MATKPSSSHMTPGPGFRVRPSLEDPEVQAVLDGFRRHPSADVSDRCNRLYTVSPQIRWLAGDLPLVGTACTVKVFAGDNLMVHKSLDVARPGQIVVVDASNSDRNAVLGDMIANKARHRGIAGFVIDGFVRDLEGVREAGLPVFGRGVSPAGPLHRGPGEINHHVCCGGVVVSAGDVVVADHDGVTIVPRSCASVVLEGLEKSRAQRAAYAARVQRGAFSTEWVDRALDEAGFPGTED